MSFIFNMDRCGQMYRRALTQVALPCAAILLCSLPALGQDVQLARTPASDVPPIVVVDVGAHHRVYGRITTVTNAATKTAHSKTNIAYTEMATGLNYQDAQGNWVEATENIDITQDGGQAVHGQSQAYFPKNVNGSLMRYVTPDGVALNFKLLGLSYQDASGKSVLFAQLKDSNGILLSSSNVVVYPDAFDGTSASVRYKYTRSGFEQDILLQGPLPDCNAWGLDPQSVVIQILTEFAGTAEPAKESIPMFDGTSETNLIFGVTQIGRGKAFTIGSDENTVIVRPHWLHLTDPNSNVDRTFLLEQVSFADLSAQLSQLSTSSGGGSASVPAPPKSRELGVASLGFHPPALKMGKPIKGPLELASAGYRETGLVLDFTTVSTGFSNFTFTNGTFFISGPVSMSGTTTFEDGAVLKYTNNASVSVGTVNWLATPFHPIVLTSKDDNSVGDTITGSTGTPTNYFANPAVTFSSSSPAANISNFRVCYAQFGLNFINCNGNLTNGQFFNCQNGVWEKTGTHSLEFDNVLWANVLTNVSLQSSQTVTFQNNTISGSSLICPVISSGRSFYFTNCILANVTNLYTGSPDVFTGNYNGLFNTTNFGSGTTAIGSNPFQTVGDGAFYLADQSPLWNLGTTNIGSNLLATLRTTTTFPPLVYSNVTISADLSLQPQAQREPGLTGLTLGYHYPPIDYALGHVYLTNGTLSIGPGTVIAGFGTAAPGGQYGVGVGPGGQFLSAGQADNLARFISYNCVQEPSTTNWYEAKPAGLLLGNFGATALPVHCRFTDFAIMANNFPFYCDEGFIYQLGQFQDCQIHGGTIQADQCASTFTNCLLDHVTGYYWNLAAGPCYLMNNLFRGCNLDFYMGYTNCAAQNNLFDKTYIYDEGSASFIGGYNGYVTNWSGVALANITLLITNVHDVYLTDSPAYQTGTLGNRYIPTSGVGSTLLNAGSTTADLLQLYFFTTTTNNVRETNSTVDISFHYVATTANGVPIDTSGKGLADYLQDLNGNGVVESGDMNWLDPYDWGFQIFITRPKTSSNLP